MTENERKLALYCLKANSDYHSEVCEECIKYPNCDHTGQDDVTETIIKALEQKPSGDAISRQAAFEAFGLSEATRKYGGDHSGYDTLMKYEIQDVLENLPPVTPEPCEVEAAQQAYSKGFEDCRQAVIEITAETGALETQARVKALPPVTPEPKMGHWIAHSDGGIWVKYYECSKCGFIKTAIEGHIGQYKFCPNCGQPKMQEVEE